MLSKLAAAAALFLVSQVGAAHDMDGQWEPYSRTAMAVTGTISFENGVMSLHGKPMFRLEPQGKGHYHLEPLQDPNPLLLNGNTLCGEGIAPTLMKISQTSDGVLSVTIMDGAVGAIGDEKEPPNICGVYNFIR